MEGDQPSIFTIRHLFWGRLVGLRVSSRALSSPRAGGFQPLHYLVGALSRAVDLIVALDPAVMEIAWLSIKLSAIFIIIAAAIGIPFGLYLRHL